MIIRKVMSDNIDFISLTKRLDKDLSTLTVEESQDERLQYDALNQLDAISWAMISYHNHLAIGCAAIKKYDEKTAEVKRVFVTEKYRGKGVARQLITSLENEASSEGYHYLILETGKNNVVAVNTYLKFNYEIIDNYPPYNHMTDSICMKKSLLYNDNQKLN